MFKNILTIAVRCLWKQRLFSFINLTGLTLGLSACIYIYLYISYELSYDAYHTKSKNIYRLSVYDDRPASNGYNSASPAIGPTLLKESPSIQAMARVDFSSFLVSNSTNKFQEDNVMIADSSLFSIFTFPLSNGDANQALTQPFSVVLSQTAARKYFGTQNTIGQTLKIDWNQYGTFDVKVTGVMKDIPKNSHFRSDMILSFTTITKKLEPQLENCWNCPHGSTYLLVDEKTIARELQGHLSSFLDQHADHLLADQKGHLQLAIEPLRDIYLHGKYPAQQTGNMSNVYMFSVIAVLILLIAGINFINLSTARASQRAKEIAIRKVVGVSRVQLIYQFLGESLLLSLTALGLALLICSLLLPSFNELCGKVISNNIFDQPQTIAFAICTSAFIGVAAGVYPAFLLSSFRPTLGLKGDTSGHKKIGVRELLVVGQFTVSIVLIIGTIVVHSQLKYISHKALGFAKDQMLVIDFHSDPLVKRHMQEIKSELTHIPNVLSASASSGIPNGGFEPANYEIENAQGLMQLEELALYMADEDFFSQYHIKTISGRTFSKDFPTDKDALVVNEALVKAMGYKDPQQIIGKRFTGDGQGTVIGVVSNFHFTSLHEKIQPLMFRTFFLANRYITLHLNSSATPVTIQEIEEKWKRIAPQRPFEFFFLDQAIDRQYKADMNFGKLFFYFGGLSILVACLGLYGLTLYSASRRTKEIGVRKVLGASVSSIVSLLSLNFIKLGCCAFVLALPIAMLGINKWLEHFAYKTDNIWWVFPVAGLVAMAIGVLTVLSQTLKAATANPVKSLRAE